VAGNILATRLPFVFPIHQVGSNGKFFAVDILSVFGRQLDVFEEEIDRIHVEFGSCVLKGAHRDYGCLWMVGSTPGPGWTDIVVDGGVLFALIGNVEDVGNRRHASAAGAARAPGLRLPSGNGSVFLGRDFHAGVSGRPAASNFELGVALQHHANRLAPGFLGELSGDDGPAIRSEFAAEAAADVVLVDADIRRRDTDRVGHLAGNAGDILRGDVDHQMIVVGPLRSGAVRLQTAMGDDRRAINSL